MSAHPVLKDHASELNPIVSKLVGATGAARDAFNRQSRSSMEEMRNLTLTAAQELEAALKKLEWQLTKSEAERPAFLRVFSIYTHLQIISQTLNTLATPIQKKIKDGVLFSDKLVSQANSLLDRQTTLLRSMLDILKSWH